MAKKKRPTTEKQNGKGPVDAHAPKPLPFHPQPKQKWQRRPQGR